MASSAVEGVATSVKTATDGTVLAVIDNQVYLSTNNANFTLVSNGEENMLPSDDVIKIIAVSPSDPNYMYVSYLTATYGTGNIYYTKDHGATWEVALYATNIYNIYDTRGFIDNYMIVYPNNPRKVLVGGIDLWTLEDSQNIGVYTPRCITLSSSHPLLSYLSTDVSAIAPCGASSLVEACFGRSCNVESICGRVQSVLISKHGEGIGDVICVCIGTSVHEACDRCFCKSSPDSVVELGEKCCYMCMSLRSVIFGASSRLERICAKALCGRVSCRCLFLTVFCERECFQGSTYIVNSPASVSSKAHM